MRGSEYVEYYVGFHFYDTEIVYFSDSLYGRHKY